MECETAETESEIEERTSEYECMKDMWDYFQQIYLPHYQIDPQLQLIMTRSTKNQITVLPKSLSTFRLRLRGN